jgi:3-(3-hydroxy-phenyl)propionate hydroxylase
MNPSHPIAVVGLGPTGGVLAALLADRGCPVLVCEREPAVVERPRAVFLDDEVMRVVQRIGCANELLPQLRPVQGMDLVDRSGRVLYRYRPAASTGPLGWAEGYLFHQPDLERVLRASLAARPMVRVLGGTELVDVQSQQDGVALRVRDAQGHTVTEQAAFVVGCDGARSTVRRHMASTTLEVLGPDARWLVVDLAALRGPPVPPFTMQYCDPARPATCVPLSGGRVRFELLVLPGEETEDLCRPERLGALLAPWLAPGSYRVDRAVGYTFHALLARGWREARLLLAGDAAHQMPPFLGQGMGCGIRDAADLAWKLAAVWRGVASASLLDSYEAERGPATHAVIATDLKLGGLIQTTDPAVAAARDADALARGGAVPLTPSRFALGAALGAAAPPAGLPFPQWRDRDGTGSDELLGHGFAVVGAVACSADARRLLDRLGCRWVDAPPPAMAAWLAAHGAAAVVVRPDRIVLATVQDAAGMDAALRALAAHVDRHADAAA